MRRWVWGLGFFGLVGCERAPRPCNPPCQYGMPCVEGVCQCSLPYEGPTCETDARDKFVGRWQGRQVCETGRSGLDFVSWKDTLSTFLYLAGPFVADYQDTLQLRLVESYRVLCTPQTLRDTAVLVEGSGEQRWDSLILRFYLRPTQSPARLSCTYFLKRR
ncbi:MAG: hypothetical protein ABDH91_05925 [Bacteroidia bacterium]